jgi:hypothetical protein
LQNFELFLDTKMKYFIVKAYKWYFKRKFLKNLLFWNYLSVCPSVPYFFAVSATKDYVTGVWPIFLLRLGPEPEPLQMEFFECFWNKIFSKPRFLCSTHEKTGLQQFLPARKKEVFGSRPNPRVQICLQKDVVL